MPDAGSFSCQNTINGFDDQTKSFVILLKRILFKILTEKPFIFKLIKQLNMSYIRSD